MSESFIEVTVPFSGCSGVIQLPRGIGRKKFLKLKLKMEQILEIYEQDIIGPDEEKLAASITSAVRASGTKAKGDESCD